MPNILSIVELTIQQATNLVVSLMQTLGFNDIDAGLIADHLIDCELRGLAYGGFSRAISIAERVRRLRRQPRPIAMLHETPVSARIDGGDHIGYVVAHYATKIAITKSETSGIAVVGADNTWYTGMLSYYAEMAAARGLVSIIASNASPWVAPFGATEGRFGTNPICFGFPSAGDPVILDIGTSAVAHAEVALARRLGAELPENVAFDREGRPTRDPAAALDGAFGAWGGHRGSGIGIVVQLLGILAGAPATSPDPADFGFLIIAMRPDLMGPEDAFRKKVAAFSDSVRSARPIADGKPVRMPFDRSRRERERRIVEDAIAIPQVLFDQLNNLSR